MNQQFTIKVQEYYKGSFYDPEGFKGIMPGATSEELTQICSQAPAGYPACEQEQPVPPVTMPAVLPSVGSTNLLVVLLLTAVFAFAISRILKK